MKGRCVKKGFEHYHVPGKAKYKYFSFRKILRREGNGDRNLRAVRIFKG